MHEPIEVGPLSIDPLHVDLAMAAARGLAGVTLLATPGVAARLAGFGTAESATARTALRLVGVRDLALAVHQVWTLDRPQDLRRVHRLHAIVDASDALVALVSPLPDPSARRWPTVVAGSTAAAIGWSMATTWARRVRSSGNGA